ncbi:MAG TPA: vanadium-dependent haloperoxidase [Gemmatimonadales bacterium]|nr:vanadium-dependent haloperoxidase [Gemmatimonadales bacterium]
MSHKSGYRAAVALLTIAAAAAACAEPAVGPVPPISAAVATLSSTPASLGWHERARALVAANNLSPLAAARVYAALSVAQYRAVGGSVFGGRRALEENRGAVAGASVTVLSFFFPAARASLEQQVLDEGDAGPGRMHPGYGDGVEMGRTAGTAMVDRVRQDGFTTPWTGTVPVGPGLWIANGPPAGATFGGVAPYFLSAGSQFRPASPPAFGSPAFLADLSEIRDLSATRTPEQRAVAVYWNFSTGSFTPPGYWDLVTANYITAHGLDEEAATRVFALTTGAMMDALIACWDAKYYYWMLRPSHADASITLTFGLPNHPSYPSGHSCASAAAATVLTAQFPEQSTELAAWVSEAGLSRMYAGIHYRFDITAGRDLGVTVAQWALAHPERIR